MSNAIVKADAVDIAGELPQLFQLAAALKQAGGFLPRHIKNEGELVAVILAGRELGLPPMTSLRSIHLVEGRVVLAADAQLALMARAGCTYQWTADGRSGTAQLRIQRPGHPPHVQTYALDDAKAAGLAGKDNWRKHPAAMLRARCVSGAAKAYCPDILAGVYVPGELDGDIVDAELIDEHGEVHGTKAEAPVQPERPFAVTEKKSASGSGATPTEPKLDEYGLAVPPSKCPVVEGDGPHKGKLWSNLPGGLLEKMTAKYDAMTPQKQQWLDYLLARRAARKAREAAEKERAAELERMADPNSEGGGYLEGDPEPPADVKRPDEEAAQ